MVRKTILLCVTLFALPFTVSAEPWNPTPLVIDCQEVVYYYFDGSVVDIPFTLSGKHAMIWLVVNTMMDRADKPRAPHRCR